MRENARGLESNFIKDFIRLNNFILRGPMVERFSPVGSDH